jgi:hypothetical protein
MAREHAQCACPTWEEFNLDLNLRLSFTLQHLVSSSHRACASMFRSIVAAEKAALQGEGPEWDTQQCRDYKEELLSVRICSSLAMGRLLY